MELIRHYNALRKSSSVNVGKQHDTDSPHSALFMVHKNNGLQTKPAVFI